MADATDSLTLQELADETGVEPRTIRSYVEKGVLPGPESLGRGARYPRETLHRLQVLTLVRDANRSLSLDHIRLLLQRLDAATIRAIAEGRQRIGAVIDTDALGLSTPPRGAALDYLLAIKSPPADAIRQKVSSLMQSHEAFDATGPGAAFEQAAKALAALTGRKPSPGAVRSEHWHRLQLTPDIELSVRGRFDTEQLAQLHRIGDALRLLLTKGPAS